VDDCTLMIRYGRIGDPGQKQTKTFPTAQKAKAEAQKKLNEKLRKGYAPAVMGERKKRPVTRRSVESHAAPKGTKQAPVVWRFETRSAAFGVFVDAQSCWVGNQAGQVVAVDHSGEVQQQLKLPDGVKCIVADGAWRYVGCDDGKVYDISGKVPFVAYEIAENVDIFWLDIFDGVLAVSDAQGGLTVVNHEEESRWSAKGRGASGWMVRLDELGVYHGHTNGVTMYDWEDGSERWHRPTSGIVLFGWQDEGGVYAATSGKLVQRFSKRGEAGAQCMCDASVFSCASSADGQLIFAGDCFSSVYCFNAQGERLWKLGTGCGTLLSMQYFDGKLYGVSSQGVLICYDVSTEAVEAARQGQAAEGKVVRAPAASPQVEINHVERVAASAVRGGVIVECYQDPTQNRVRVRPVSEGYHTTWNVQFPRDIRTLGARFWVEQLVPSRSGGFYRAQGEIKRVE
jgi:outer membrane protein assembly factor BamB/predicted DNA-binding WGR domain protein